MYKIAICDDTEEMLSGINKLVLRYNEEKSGRFSVPELFGNPFLLSEKMGDGAVFDVLLLDIFMPGISGIDIAREKRLKDRTCQIVFITTTREFAVEAIALNTTHYLVKPFTYEQLGEALDRAFDALDAKQIKTVAAKSRDGEIYKVNVNDIISIECFGHIQRLTCTNCTFEMRDGMPFITSNMLDKRFFTIHKGVIVNMDQITFVGADYVKMSDDRTVHAAKRNMPDFRKKYLDYTVGG